MTTAEKKINILVREVRILKERLDSLVPLDNEGDYKAGFLKNLDRARKSKVRFSFKDGSFSASK